jgi:hypothetical protein
MSVIRVLMNEKMLQRLPYFLDNRLTDDEVLKPYAPAALYPQEDCWYSFLLEAESTPGP